MQPSPPKVGRLPSVTGSGLLSQAWFVALARWKSRIAPMNSSIFSRSQRSRREATRLASSEMSESTESFSDSSERRVAKEPLR